MTIVKKYNIISAIESFCIVGIFFVIIRKIFDINMVVYIGLLSIIILVVLSKITWFYLIKKYLNILDKQLDPKKFLEITDIEFKSIEKRISKRDLIYKNFLKLNYIAGYSCLNEKEKALEVLNTIDINESVKKSNFELIYCYNKSLLLLTLNKKEEANEMYEKLLEITEKNKKVKQKLPKEIAIYIEILKYWIYDENNTEKLLELYEKLLSTGKTKRFIISTKFSLAELKEKQGKVEEAKKYYKEVVENGNKLYIVKKVKQKLLELE